MEGFDIRNGNAPDGVFNGGGIFVTSNSIAAIRNNRIYDNSAFKNDGGIFIDGYTDITVEDNQIYDNQAAVSYGRGIHLDGGSDMPVVFHSNIISNNDGCGIYSYSSITVTHSDLWQNTPDHLGDNATCDSTCIFADPPVCRCWLGGFPPPIGFVLHRLS